MKLVNLLPWHIDEFSTNMNNVLTISDLISDTEDSEGFCVASGGNMRFRYNSGGNVGETHGGNLDSVRREGKYKIQLHSGNTLHSKSL